MKENTSTTNNDDVVTTAMTMTTIVNKCTMYTQIVLGEWEREMKALTYCMRRLEIVHRASTSFLLLYIYPSESVSVYVSAYGYWIYNVRCGVLYLKFFNIKLFMFCLVSLRLWNVFMLIFIIYFNGCRTWPRLMDFY